MKKKENRLHFGIDWGDYSVRIVGIRLVGSEFELTHCFFFDLSPHSDPGYLQQLIVRRLKRVNFQRGVVTINLPVKKVHFKGDNPEAKTISPPGGRSAGQSSMTRSILPLTLQIPEKTFTGEWIRRLNFLDMPVQGRLEGFSLPMLRKDPSDSELSVYLKIDYSGTMVFFARGAEIMDFQNLPFVIENFLPDSFKINRARRKKALQILQNTRIHLQEGNLRWKSKYSLKEMHSSLSQIENRMADLISTLRQKLCYWGEKFGTSQIVLQIAGAGARFPWLKQMLEKELQVPIESVQTFARMKGGKGVRSKKLRSVAPLFAEAVSLALSPPPFGPYVNFYTRINRISRRKIRGWKIRLVALSVVFLVLVFTFGMKLQVDGRCEEFLRLRAENNDLKAQRIAVENYLQMGSILAAKHVHLPTISDIPRFSSIFTIIAELIPNGNWITRLQVIPAKKIKDFHRATRHSKGYAVILHGRAVSKSFISNFRQRLHQSGYFSQIIVKRNPEQERYSRSIPYILVTQIRPLDE